MIKRLYRKIKNFIWEVNFRRKHRFKSLDIFNLNHATAKFIVPRLKLFRERTYSYPMGLTPEKWKVILDDMIFALEFEINQWDKEYTDKDFKRIQKGFKLFGKYFRDLWI